jgi:outer membrane protein TolC
MKLQILPAKQGLLLLFLVSAQAVVAQSAPYGAITLVGVVDDAEKNYPSIHISEEELNAAVANIRLARTAYLPRIDGLAQFNRATRNNVFGALLPQATIPSLSGPVIGTNNGGSVWGSATGLLINWQPFDFGARHASVQAAAAAREKAFATNDRTRLEIGTASADAYLTVLAAKKMRSSAQSAVDNWETLRRSVHALTAAELKPGADESRVDAEKAAALTQLALADQAIATSQATLHKFMSNALNGDLTSARLEGEIPSLPIDIAYNSSSNPAMLEQRAAVAQSVAQLQATERSWVPQINLEASGYARGTGAETNGQRLLGANGLAPNVGNYAVGVNITFPFMDFASIHAKEAAQSASLRAAKANEQLTDKNLQEQFTQAQVSLTATQAIAQNTPIELKAAHSALDQATARYKAGLVPIDDVAQAQRLMVQAEMDDAIARLNVWRAFLRFQFIRGDLQPFLQEASR